MNPYESGMVSPAGFNAVMTQNIAKKQQKTFQFKKYPYFYNPMWGLFGDSSTGVPGSYYYPQEPYWNIFDQVLIRPELIPHFSIQDLEIISFCKNENFLNDAGVIDKNISDHLPLKFALNL